MALPKWLAEQGHDYDPEREALEQLLGWAIELGWSVRVGDAPDGADATIQRGDSTVRVEVKRKPANAESGGRIRLQAIPSFLDAYLVREPDQRAKWDVELGAVRLGQPWNKRKFGWLLTRLTAG